MQTIPIETTLTPKQREWLKKKMAECGITSMSEEKEKMIAFFLNGPTMTKKEIRAIERSRKRGWTWKLWWTQLF